MGRTIKTEKIIPTHPRTGSRLKIDSAIYKPIKAAILQSLKVRKGWLLLWAYK